MTWLIKHYRHCDTKWTDEHCCACNDRCPVCNSEVEPYKVEPADYQGSCGDPNCPDCAAGRVFYTAASASLEEDVQALFQYPVTQAYSTFEAACSGALEELQGRLYLDDEAYFDPELSSSREEALKEFDRLRWDLFVQLCQHENRHPIVLCVEDDNFVLGIWSIKLK